MSLHCSDPADFLSFSCCSCQPWRGWQVAACEGFATGRHLLSRIRDLKGEETGRRDTALDYRADHNVLVLIGNLRVQELAFLLQAKHICSLSRQLLVCYFILHQSPIKDCPHKYMTGPSQCVLCLKRNTISSINLRPLMFHLWNWLHLTLLASAR